MLSSHFRSIGVVAGLGACLLSIAQYNITELGRLDYHALRNSDLSNLWGYVDEEGNEYAIVGVNGTGPSNPGGVSVVDINDPANPQEIFFFPGPPSIWREVKVYNDHAYITTEAQNGRLTIIDLSPLPQSTDLPAIVWTPQGWGTSHSLFIDENGRLYIFGSSRGNGGAIMYDLTSDPMSPVEVGEFDNWYVHDGFARGDTLYAAHIYDGFFSIVDVSDPASPVLLGTQATPNNFTHNTWLDDSGRYLFTTDERTDSYVAAYDVSDPTDIQFLDKLQSDPGSGTIPHNTYWLNGYLVTSYYTYGVVIYDATYPDNLVEVGHYDTSPNYSGDGFNGAWGVYPYLPSGRLIVSDIQRGLVILGPTYQHACWLEGTVTNALTAAPVSQATVTIQGINANDITGFDGQYATGYHQAGTYTITVSAPGYASTTVPGVQLVNGQVTVQDVQLQPLESFAWSGTVVEQGTGTPVADATVLLEDEVYTYTATTNAQGVFEVPAMFTGTYTITAGRWGWHTVCLAPQSIVPGTTPITVELPSGYRDDFALDLGWTVSGTAQSGMWERGVPVGTMLNSAQSNPGADVPGDCGEHAYVTGNGGGAAGDDDVDGGNTVLLSPVFDVTGLVDPRVRYHRWFFNAGGTGSPNDDLVIALENGSIAVTLETVMANAPDPSTWQLREFAIAEVITPTATMRLRVTARDVNPGHVVEAGFDLFEVVSTNTQSVGEVAPAVAFSIAPNPANDHVLVMGGAGVLEVNDATGRRVMGPLSSASGRWDLDASALPAGLYLVSVSGPDGLRTTQRLMVQR
jgi:choice-of-anchor B domain-containing protein